jgi:phage-related protein
MILLEGFIKKQQKTPKGDLDLAERRRKEVVRHDQKKT